MRGALRYIFVILVIIGLSACVSARKRVYASLSSQGGGYHPVRITNNFHYVGTSDIAVYLLETDDGLVLFDTAYEHMHDLVIANIRSAGFDPHDIQVILNTQAHMDHAGGIEKMRLLTGAQVKARRIAMQELLDGSRNDFSALIRFMPYSRVGRVGELENQDFKEGASALTWHKTPGHTKGCTSWSLKLDIQGAVRDVLIVCGFRRLPFTKIVDNKRYPNIKVDYAKTVDVLGRLKENCDILLGSHMSDFKVGKTIAELKNGRYDFDEGRCQSELNAAIEKIERDILRSE